MIFIYIMIIKFKFFEWQRHCHVCYRFATPVLRWMQNITYSHISEWRKIKDLKIHLWQYQKGVIHTTLCSAQLTSSYCRRPHFCLNDFPMSDSKVVHFFQCSCNWTNRNKDRKDMHTYPVTIPIQLTIDKPTTKSENLFAQLLDEDEWNMLCIKFIDYYFSYWIWPTDVIQLIKIFILHLIVLWSNLCINL